MFRLRAHTVTNFWLWKRLLKPIFGRLHILSFSVRPAICLLRFASYAAVSPATLLLPSCYYNAEKNLFWCFHPHAAYGLLEAEGRTTQSFISQALPYRQALPLWEQRGVSTNTPKVQVGNPIPVSWHLSDGTAERLPGTSPSIMTACTPASPPPCFLDTKQGPQELMNVSALPQTPHLTLDTVEFSLLASVHHLQDQNHSHDFHPCLALQKPSWRSSTWNSSGCVFKQGLHVQTGAVCSNRGPVHLAHSKFMSPAPSSPAWAQTHTADCLKTDVIWIK